MKLLLPLLSILTLAVTAAADEGYNETADAKLDIKRALAIATNTPVIIIFGANWCPDCLELDDAMKQGTNATLLAQDFRIVKVDVGHLDKNVDLARSYGVALENGIPIAAIISPKNEVLYITQGAELADAQKKGDDGIYQFFKRVAASSKPKK